MTQNLEKTVERSATATERRSHKPRRWWIVPLTLAIIAFLLYQTPPYLSLNPENSRIPLQFPEHYWLLVGHVGFGSVAFVTMCLQLWPWLRRRHPRAHRISGRIFVFGGALPSAFFALAMLPVSYPAGRIGVAASATLWSIAAVIGFFMARRRRYREHRRWMLYSIAIVWGLVIWGFVIGMPFALGWITYTGDFDHIVEAARWVGWVGNLIVVQWWLERTRGRPLDM